ncbi:hypothetical protein [Tunturiibacter gelidiferens]|uniref:hypothetical protein n=1 Tax=Tunturiibacter gelidiferens TaxID=3069689 RepID=UPI003D9BF2C7
MTRGLDCWSWAIDVLGLLAENIRGEHDVEKAAVSGNYEAKFGSLVGKIVSELPNSFGIIYALTPIGSRTSVATGKALGHTAI